jgi:hypothetical protein
MDKEVCGFCGGEKYIYYTGTTKVFCPACLGDGELRICDRCGAKLDLSPSWRHNPPYWEHKCEDISKEFPQAGHLGTGVKKEK